MANWSFCLRPILFQSSFCSFFCIMLSSILLVWARWSSDKLHLWFYYCIFCIILFPILLVWTRRISDKITSMVDYIVPTAIWENGRLFSTVIQSHLLKAKLVLPQRGHQPQWSFVKCPELPSRRFASICNPVLKLWSPSSQPTSSPEEEFGQLAHCDYGKQEGKIKMTRSSN